MGHHFSIGDLFCLGLMVSAYNHSQRPFCQPVNLGSYCNSLIFSEFSVFDLNPKLKGPKYSLQVPPRIL